MTLLVRPSIGQALALDALGRVVGAGGDVETPSTPHKPIGGRCAQDSKLSRDGAEPSQSDDMNDGR
jgi:hypothetical protein